jgi:hypothetical protein
VECWLVVDSGLFELRLKGEKGGTAAIVQLQPALPLLVAGSCGAALEESRLAQPCIYVTQCYPYYS